MRRIIAPVLRMAVAGCGVVSIGAGARAEHRRGRLRRSTGQVALPVAVRPLHH